MQIFVINLPKDFERRESITRQLSDLGLNYEIIPGVYGKDLSAEGLAKAYDYKKSMRIQCRDLTLSEIGCSLSHILVYREIVKRRLPYALILEDDAVLCPDLPQIIKALDSHLDRGCRQVILLSSFTPEKRGDLPLWGRYRMAPFQRGYYAHAYVVTEKAAEALIKFLYPVTNVPDSWERIRDYRVVDMAGVIPEVSWQNQRAFGSSTTQDRIKNDPVRIGIRKLLFKVRRAFWITVDRLRAQWHRYRHCG